MSMDDILKLLVESRQQGQSQQRPSQQADPMSDLIGGHINVGIIVPAIENLFSIKFLAKDVYMIPDLPSDVHAADVVATAVIALVLSLVAAILPSWRAAPPSSIPTSR